MRRNGIVKLDAGRKRKKPIDACIAAHPELEDTIRWVAMFKPPPAEQWHPNEKTVVRYNQMIKTEGNMDLFLPIWKLLDTMKR